MSARGPNAKSTHAGRGAGSRPRASRATVRSGDSGAHLAEAGAHAGHSAAQRAQGAGSNVDTLPDPVLVFAALGDKTRLHLVSRLCAGGPLSITRLSDGVEVTRQAITKHLNILAGAGLVRDIRVGRERLWELETRQLDAARRCLDRISGQWDEALARLKSAVEGDEH